MKIISFVLLISAGLAISYALDSCENMWDADFQDFNLNICPVATLDDENEQMLCSFPFEHNGYSYNHCIVSSEDDYYPRCKSSDSNWHRCSVPNDAVIFGVTTRKDGSFSVNGASTKGGTLVWIRGTRFATDTFSTSPTAVTSNVVHLVSDFSSYECEIHPDATTTTQITCYTPAMNPGTYKVIVEVKGDLIPSYQYANEADAVITVSDQSTPKLKKITPISGVPGSFITIDGEFKTNCYLRDTDGCSDDAGARILRVYVGGQQCQLMNETSNELYQSVTSGSMYCQLNKPEIGYFNASLLVNNEYGRSETSTSIFYVSPNQDLYNFQTYAQIDSIYPHVGSVNGGTLVTITGQYLYHDENVPAVIDIAGKPCEVVEFNGDNSKATRIICKSPECQSVPNESYGNRGITLYTEAVFTSDLTNAVPSENAIKTTLDSASVSGAGGNSDVTVWMKGFLYPRVNSSYEFTYSSNKNKKKLFISTDATRANRAEVSSGTRLTLMADTYYYFEAIASGRNGNLRLEINAKMLQTKLNQLNCDSVAVKNEIQEIDITSTRIPEAYTIALANASSAEDVSNVSEKTGKVQSILIHSSGIPFVLNLYGADTVCIKYDSAASVVETALNDLPFLYPNMATVSEEFITDGENLSRKYIVTFSVDLGDVPLLTESLGYANLSISEESPASGKGTKSHIMIGSVPTDRFDLSADSAEDIQAAIESGFGIRCPASIQIQDSSVAGVYDFEGCSWNTDMVNETAYCGKCSSTSRHFFMNLNASLEYEYLCLAYKLEKTVPWIWYHEIDPLFKTLKTGIFRIEVTADNKWHYQCWNIKEEWEKRNPNSLYSYKNIKINSAGFWPYYSNQFIDVVSMRQQKPLGYQDDEENDLGNRRVIPSLQFKHGSLETTKTENSLVKFSFCPTNCTHGFEQLVLMNSFKKNEPTMLQASAASPPVTGTFELEWKGTTLSIASDASESDVSSLLKSVTNAGDFKVTRSKDCSGYKWSIKWICSGDKPLISIPNNTLAGINVEIAVNGVQDGGALLYPLPGDMLRTFHEKPQVSVMINGIPSQCSNCSFHWSSDVTPVVNNIDASSLSAIVLTGTGFSETPLDNLVKIGEVPCIASASSATQIICAAGENPVGTYNFSVNVLGKGEATINTTTQATFSLAVTSVGPIKGSAGGGNILFIYGSGFSKSSLVMVGGNECPVIETSYSIIKCIAPSSSTSSNLQVDVTVFSPHVTTITTSEATTTNPIQTTTKTSTNGLTSTIEQTSNVSDHARKRRQVDSFSEQTYTSTLNSAYLYDYGNTPIVTSITPNILSVAGGETVFVEGTGLPVVTSGVRFNNIEISLVSSNATHIILRSPPLEPGVYSLNITIPDFGMAKVDTKIEYKLYVTSFTPSVGSIRGGTLVTVYGDGFDQINCQNNLVSFGAQNCLIQNCSSSWIKCQTSSAYITHQITNDGSDPYYGKGYAWSTSYLTINIGDSVRWSWAPPTGIRSVKFKVLQVQDPLSHESIGFDSGEPTLTGSYTFQFNQPGVYHYWSGYVEASRQITFRGVIKVLDFSDKELELDVRLDGYSAQKCAFPFNYNGNAYSACTTAGESYSWCSPSVHYTGQKIPCDIIEIAPDNTCQGTDYTAEACGVNEPTSAYGMMFTSCTGNAATINSIDVGNATYDTLITISGSGFGTTQCENRVMIGNHECAVKSSTSGSIVCQIGRNSGLYPNYEYDLKVLVANKGYAVHNNTFKIKFLAKIDSFTPNAGSTSGGTKITITGDGFLPSTTFLTIGSISYYEPTLTINSSMIELVTEPNEDSYNSVTVIANDAKAECAGDCSFEYSTSITPALSGVSPSSINGPVTIDISGNLFGTDSSKVVVKIGSETCDVQSVDDEKITCSINGISTGNQIVTVSVNDVGNAMSYTPFYVYGELAILSVSPSVGSIYGGQLVELTGNGFDKNTRVSFGDYPCFVESAVSNKLVCRTIDTTGIIMNTETPPTTPILTTRMTPIQTTTKTSTNGSTSTIEQTSNVSDHARRRRQVDNFSEQNYTSTSTAALPSTETSITTVSLPETGQKINLNSYGTVYSSSDLFFTFSSTATPIVNSVSPSSGSGGSITLIGSGFGINMDLLNVTVGNSQCNILSVTNTEIICTLGPYSAGSHSILVNRKDQGNSNENIQYTFSLEVSSLSHTEGSIGGGLNLVLHGSGFSMNTSVQICGKKCNYLSSYFDNYKCIVPEAEIKNKDTLCTIDIMENGIPTSSSFTYKVALTPSLTGVSPLRGGTGGGTLLTITGSGFPTDGTPVTVSIGGSLCVIASISNSQITCVTEPYPYSSIKTSVNVEIDGKGLALNLGLVQFEYIDLWSSRFTWGGLSPPGEGEIAVISHGQHIYFDAASTPVLKGIIIQGGSLIFDDNQDVSLNVEYVMIIGNGKFQVGTEDKPFQHNAIITMYGSVRSIELPTYGSKVIALRNGTLDLHGKPVGVTWTNLGSTVESGSNVIVLKEPVIWTVGSQIVIATTGDKFSPRESELAFINAKSDDNMTLTLDRNLEFGHLGEERTVGSGLNSHTVSLRAEVGLLTRNVVFKGNNDDSWSRLKTAEACPTGFNPAEFATQTCFLGRYGPELGSNEFGGTIFIFAGQDQANDKETVIARLSNVELFHVGQAFKKGRYPIHFHMNGDMPSSFVKECAIHQSFNRAINIHASNDIRLTRNVIYNIMGGAYFLEDGVEHGNIFRYNLAVFVRTSSSLLNEDVTPAAFWATNANNTYEHNAVAGSTHFGWWYRVLDHPEGPSYVPDYCPKKQPFGKHFNNTVHSTGRFGIWVFPGITPTVTGECSDSSPSVAVFDHFTSWANDKGAEFVNSNNIQFNNFTVFDQHDSGLDIKIIKGNSQVNSPYRNTFFDEALGPMIADTVIIGNTINGENSHARRGLTWAWDRGLLVKNTTFINYPTATAMDVTSIDGTCGDRCGGWNNKVSDLKFDNCLYRHSFRWAWDNVLIDMDGSLTGSAGDIAVYKDAFTEDDSRCHDDARFENGIVCSSMENQIRFAFNNFNPSAALSFNITRADGKMVQTQKLKKRLTHTFGFMVHIEAKNEYTMFFDTARPTNMSYNGAFYSLKPGDWLIVKHPLTQKPDQVKITSQLSKESSEPLTYENNNQGDWYWDNETYSVSYLIKNVDTEPLSDVRVNFEAFKCGAKPPEAPAYRAPIKERPPTALLWSDSETWDNSFFLSRRRRRSASTGIPEDGDSIVIPPGVYVIVDQVLPRLNVLQIEGYLELDNDRDHKLEADMIFINGGELIVGWENNPILTNVEIILHGEKNALDFQLPNGLANIGGKGIGVYGGLDIHGKPRDVQWTQLVHTANAGANTITLKHEVDWLPGEQIIISTTSYTLEQTEVMNISSVSQDKKTLTLTENLTYDHLAYGETFPDGTKYEIAAAVGLLTRNVKIVGAEYENQVADSYGFRIIASDYLALVNGFPTYYRGFCRIENAEFVRFGQFDRTSGADSKYGILLNNLGEYNASRPTYIKNNAFHHGLGVAVGVFSSNRMLIENNIIHRTLDYGIRLEGTANVARGNLVLFNQWGSTYLKKEAKLDKTYWGAIDIYDAESAVVEDNFIAGSERVGLNMRGDLCEGDSLGANLTHSIKNNTIYGAGAGVVIEPNVAYKRYCLRARGFTIYKSHYWGIYYQGTSEIIIENNVLVDNQVNVYTQIFGTPPQTHVVTDKKTITRNMLVVGRSAASDCIKDVYPRNSSDTNTFWNKFFAGPTNRGRIGLVFPTYVAKLNGLPTKPWANVMSYNQIGGHMLVNNVTFANWKTSCGDQDAAFTSSLNNEDGQHPVTMTGNHLFAVEESSKLWLYRASLGSINPSDCVDMECDGKKKNLLIDTDGSFLGYPGSAISQSDYGWGDQQRGSGEFRIPAAALANPDGSFIDPSEVYEHPGIVRDETACSYRPSWQAYQCDDSLTYRMLIIESMDADTEDRRLSPVAILSDNGYLDLINGPQDHGWCFGYTCQKRISTFMALVAADKSYDIYLTSTPPETIRFRVINSDSSFKIRLSLFNQVSQRLDVYKDGTYVAPTNAEFDNGEMRIKKPSPIEDYMPTYSDTSGANLFIKDEMKIYWAVDGASYYDIKVAPVLFLSFGLPAITPEEFFNEATIVGNFALLLGIDPSKIRRVEIVRADSSKRRKRDTDSMHVVNIIIEDNAVTYLNNTSAIDSQKESMLELEATIKNMYTTNQLQANAQLQLNITIESLATQTSESNLTALAVPRQAIIQVVTEASDCKAQVPCTTQPLIRVVDQNGNIIKNLGNSEFPWVVQAQLTSTSNPNAVLIHETEANVVNGYATFSKFGISETTEFSVAYSFKTPVGVDVSSFDTQSVNTSSVTAKSPQLTCKQCGSDISVAPNTYFSMNVTIADYVTKDQVTNITWANHEWTAEIKLHALKYYESNGSLSTPISSVMFDPINGLALFESLRINEIGMYVIEFKVETTNNDYSFTCLSNTVTVEESTPSFDNSFAPNYVLKFDGNIDLIEKSEVKANIYNYMKGYNIDIALMDVFPGVHVTFYSNSVSELMMNQLNDTGLTIDPHLYFEYASIDDTIINCTSCVYETTTTTTTSKTTTTTNIQTTTESASTITESASATAELVSTTNESASATAELASTTTELASATAELAPTTTDELKTCNELCYGSGDPHYRTVDGVRIEINNTCSYILAVDKCTEPDLSIIVDQERRPWSRLASYMKAIRIKYYESQIKIDKNFHIDGNQISLPYNTIGYRAFREGRYIIFEEFDGGVRVQFDGDKLLKMNICETFEKCGLCKIQSSDLITYPYTEYLSTDTQCNL